MSNDHPRAVSEHENPLCMHLVKTVVLRFNLHVEHFNKLMHLSTSPWSCASLTDVGALLALLCRSSSGFFLVSAPSSLDTSDLYFSVSFTCSVHLEASLGNKGINNCVHTVVGSYVFGLPLVRLRTGLKVQLLGDEALDVRDVKVQCFLHNLNGLVASVLKSSELKHPDKLDKTTNELFPQAPLGSPQLLHYLHLFLQVLNEVLPLVFDGFLISHCRVELILGFGFLQIVNEPKLVPCFRKRPRNGTSMALLLRRSSTAAESIILFLTSLSRASQAMDNLSNSVYKAVSACVCWVTCSRNFFNSNSFSSSCFNMSPDCP